MRRTLDGLEEVTSSLQASIGTVVALRRKAHGSAIGATRLRLSIVGSGRVPGQAHQHRAIGAVVVLVLVLQLLGNGIVHLLVVLEAGHEGRLRGRLDAEQLGVVLVGSPARGSNNAEAGTEQHTLGIAALGGALLAGTAGIATAGGLAECLLRSGEAGGARGTQGAGEGAGGGCHCDGRLCVLLAGERERWRERSRPKNRSWGCSLRASSQRKDGRGRGNDDEATLGVSTNEQRVDLKSSRGKKSNPETGWVTFKGALNGRGRAMLHRTWLS